MGWVVNKIGLKWLAIVFPVVSADELSQISDFLVNEILDLGKNGIFLHN